MGLISDFTGESQRGDIRAGQTEARDLLDRGYNDFRQTRERYLDRSLGEFDVVNPNIQTGQDANNLYRVALGLDGREAQAKYFNEFNSDPGYQAIQDNAVNTLENSAAARGGLFSGGNIRGVTDRVSLLKNNLFTDRLNRLQQLGQSGANLGFNTASSRSNLLYGTGADIGNAQFGLGQLKANNAINANNAIGQTRGATLNNLLKIGELGTKAATAAAGFV